MLVLSMKAEQIIKMGTQIEIYFLKIKNKRVVVGIDAPKNIDISRILNVTNKDICPPTDLTKYNILANKMEM